MDFESESSNSETSDDHYQIYDFESEPEDEYNVGGFMKLPKNATIANQYEIIQKLGWGHGGIVYLCKDLEDNTFKALKIMKSHKFYKQEFKDELAVLNKIFQSPQAKYTVKLFSHFKVKGNDATHVCAVYELLGASLYEVLKFYAFKGLPLGLCKFIIKEILMALDFFHNTCGVFLGDLRLKNVLLELTSSQWKSLENSGVLTEKLDFAVFKHTDTPLHVLNQCLGCNFPLTTPSKPKKIHKKNKKKQVNSKSHLEQLARLGLINEEFLIKFVNFGSANFLEENCIREIPTLHYRSPEVLLKMHYTSAIDMWSLGCLVFELVTGHFLFEPFKEKGFSKEDDLFGQIVENFGEFGPGFIQKSEVFGRYFQQDFKLKNITNIRKWPLKHRLIEEFGIVPEEAQGISDFMHEIMRYDPTTRITAKQALDHNWLKSKTRENWKMTAEQMKKNKELIHLREKKYWKACLDGDPYIFEPIYK